MLTLTRWLLVIGIVLTSCCCCPNAFAVADKESQGRWTKPTGNRLPDKEVPGFLVNLGPTGAPSVLISDDPNTRPSRIRSSVFEFIHRGTNGAGYVAYGGEFTPNAGLVDAVAGKASVGGDNYIGRVGADVIAHKLSQAFADSSLGVNLRIKDELPDGFAYVRSRT